MPDCKRSFTQISACQLGVIKASRSARQFRRPCAHARSRSPGRHSCPFQIRVRSDAILAYLLQQQRQHRSPPEKGIKMSSPVVLITGALAGIGRATANQGGSSRRRGCRSARQCGRTRPRGYRIVEPLCRQHREEGRTRRWRACQTARDARGHCCNDRLPGIRQSGFPHRADNRCQRRQDRTMILAS